METTRRLFIPVILGTIRQGRMSAHAAQFVAYQLSGRDTVETELIDIATLPLSRTDEGQAIKDPTFSAKMNRADAMVIVAPEYNHGYPGLLKHVLDTLLSEYIHKAGPFGGTRVIENLLPVLRELGLVTIFWDVNFSKIHKVFDKTGKLLDDAHPPQLSKFLDELIWMAKTLRHGREQIAIEQ